MNANQWSFGRFEYHLILLLVACEETGGRRDPTEQQVVGLKLVVREGQMAVR